MPANVAAPPLTRASRLELLPGILRQRILVLDGAMGTMLQRHRFSEQDFRGARFASHPRDVRGDNDLLSITRPDAVRAVHAGYLDAGSDIISTNTFTATRIAQADYGLEDIAREMNEAAARLAREAADAAEARDGRPRYVAGSLGPTNRTASISPDVNDPAARNVSFEELAAAYRESAEGLIAGGADLLLVETIFDTLNAKAAIFAIEDAFEALGLRLPVIISGTIVDASGQDPVGPDGRGVLEQRAPREPAAGRPQLRARRQAAARARRGAGAACAGRAVGLSQRRPPERAGRLRRDARPDRRRAGRVGEGRAAQRRRWLLRDDARARCGDRGGGRRGSAQGHPGAHARDPARRPRAADHPHAGRRVRQRRRADQRHRLPQVRTADGRRTGRRGRGRRDRARPGGQRRGDARRQHGRGDARRRRGDDPLPPPPGQRTRYRRGPGHGRQLALVDHRGRAAPAPGQGRGQLDLAQGGRGRVPAPGIAVPPLRRRGDRDGVRRAGPGGHDGAQGRDPDPRLPPADRAVGVRSRGRHPRPQRVRDRDRDRGARTLRRRLLRGGPPAQGVAAPRADQRRRVQRVVRVPRQRPRARGDPRGVPVPRDPGRDGHGDRQRGRTAAVRRHRRGPPGARGGRRPGPATGCHGAPARDRPPVRGRGRPGARRRQPRVARAARQRAADPCPGRGDRRVHRRGHRGGAPAHQPAPGRHRGPADGRHERGRRPVRRRTDVPAPGGQERPGDEEGGGASHPVPRGPARGHGTPGGHDRDGDGQGRRARHRQEHRGRRARLQRLRGHRPGRDGARCADPGDRARGRERT